MSALHNMIVRQKIQLIEASRWICPSSDLTASAQAEGTIKENTISFRAVWQRWAPLYITLRWAHLQEEPEEGGKWGVRCLMQQGHLSNPCDAGRNLINRDNNGGIMPWTQVHRTEKGSQTVVAKCVLWRMLAQASLLSWTSVLAPCRAVEQVLHLLSEVSSLKNRHKHRGPEGSLICQVDTEWGQAAENHHRNSQLERRMRHRMCHWKYSINWNLSWNLPKSELFAIVWVRKQFTG